MDKKKLLSLSMGELILSYILQTHHASTHELAHECTHTHTGARAHTLTLTHTSPFRFDGSVAPKRDGVTPLVACSAGIHGLVAG